MGFLKYLNNTLAVILLSHDYLRENIRNFARSCSKMSSTFFEDYDYEEYGDFDDEEYGYFDDHHDDDWGQFIKI